MAVGAPTVPPLVLQKSIFHYSALGKAKRIIHGVSRRRAEEITSLRELNLRPDADTDGEHAMRHRILFCNALGVHVNKTVWFDGSQPGPVQVVGRQDCGKGARDWATRIQGVRGVVTKETDVFLCTLLNDDVQVLFVDPRWYVTGIVTVSAKEHNTESLMEALDLMEQEGGVSRKELVALISPSLGPCCYKFDDPSLPGAQHRSNLWDIVRGALNASGLLGERIINPRLCTSCKPFDFYSRHVAGAGAGANAVAIGVSDAGNFGQVLAQRRANAEAHRKARPKEDPSLREISLSIEEKRLNASMKCPYGQNKVYIRSVLTGSTAHTNEEPELALRCAIMQHIGQAEGGHNVVDKAYIEQCCCGDYTQCVAYRKYLEKKGH